MIFKFYNEVLQAAKYRYKQWCAYEDLSLEDIKWLN